MNKLLSITISLSLVLFGFIIMALLVRFFNQFTGLGLFGGFIIGFVVGVIEVNTVRRLIDPVPKYYYLDNIIFPFVSIGIACAIVIF